MQHKMFEEALDVLQIMAENDEVCGQSLEMDQRRQGSGIKSADELVCRSMVLLSGTKWRSVIMS